MVLLRCFVIKNCHKKGQGQHIPSFRGNSVADGKVQLCGNKTGEIEEVGKELNSGRFVRG